MPESTAPNQAYVRQRERWMALRNKRGGHPPKVRLGLRKKLFFLIVALISGLLAVVYTMTLSDEERVLRRELKIRGGTVARNLADSIYNSYANLVQDRMAKADDPFVFNPDEPSGFEPLAFSDAMKKAGEQQDFVAGYAIDPWNRAFVHSARKGYLYPLPTPDGIFDFKAIYPVKLALMARIEREGLPVQDVTGPDLQQKLCSSIPVGTNAGLLLEPVREKLKVYLVSVSNTLFLQTVSETGAARRIPLAIATSNLPALAGLALTILREEYDESVLLLMNTANELRRIRRQVTAMADKDRLAAVFSGLERLVERGTLFRNALSGGLISQYSNAISEISDGAARTNAQRILSQAGTAERRFEPFVQVYQPSASGETLLYINYPMCETDKYFSTYRGEVHLLLSQTGITYTINYAKEKLQLAALLAIAAGTFFTLVMAFFITSPIKKLMGAMRRVGVGDLEQIVLVRVKDEIGVLSEHFNEMTEGLREKEKIRSAMNKAVSKEIAEVMLSGELKLGGDKKIVTVLFSDIRGFTTISEAHTPEEVVELLNEYLTLMTNIVEKHRGNVDKFVGDEIMALWGAPKSYGNDAIAAVKAALEMMEVLDRFNAERRAKNLIGIDIGIGLNTGDVIAANMGSENRMNYTVIGDNVNLGARLEGTNKMYKTHIIISENTLREVKDYIYYRELDLIRVKGKNEPVSIYEVVALTPAGEAVQTTRE
ncbi:MAG TPA: adenylate/guanylate cyclase domain-containing protein, partial [Spirochaetota bacterium]|nr:adenylate/guanylate cyclase domain-containing protein [Spirochaetota bacterium]HPN83137.1 adenylate/guanylate cyclase domain-containing protein [Spirochaetota bacterium]